jgi:hypothetical protein
MVVFEKGLHEVDLLSTYRHVINLTRGEVEKIADNADLETRGGVAQIFTDIEAVFNSLEQGKNELSVCQLQNPDLNPAGLQKKKQAILTKSANEAQAARDRAVATTGRLEAKFKAAVLPKLPATKDLAAQQMALLNLKNDFKMLLDSVNVAAVADAMLSELKNRVEVGDELAIYLLGADRWPEMYLKSRGQDGAAIEYGIEAAEVMQPLIADSVRVQAILLRQINASGGLRAVLANVDGYLQRELSDMAGMASLPGWNTAAH